MIVTGNRIILFVACWLVSFSAASAADPPPTTTGELVHSAERVEAPASKGELVALDLWVVALHMPKDVVQEDKLGPLLARVGNLPAGIGERDDARKLLDRLKDQDAIRRLQTFRMSTRSGQKGHILLGTRTPTVTGMSISDFGQTNSIQYQQVGTVVQWTPTVVNAGDIQVEFNYERSDIENSSEIAISEPKNGKPIMAQNIASLTFTTTVTVKSGEAVLISLSGDSEEGNSNLLILSAAIVGQTPTE